MKKSTNHVNNWYYLQNTKVKFERYLNRIRQMQKEGTFQNLLLEQQKQMLRRLDILYRRLKAICQRFGIKLAGATLAFLLSTGVYAEAQYFNEKTGDKNPLNEFQDSQSATLSFVDIDGDGDMDFFAIGKDNHFYRNTGDENNPVFVKESYSDLIYLPEDYNGSVTFVDIDDDGDFDAILSKNNSTENLEPIFLRNEGTATEPDFIWEQDSDIEFPGGNNLKFVDIDADNDYDIFLREYSGKYYLVQFYENTGNANEAIFTKQDNANNPLYNKFTFTNSNIQFFDYDRDNDYDVLEGSNYWMNTGGRVFPNYSKVSDKDNPFYALPITNYFYVVDIDNDTDQDIFISTADGRIKYFENEESYDLTDITLIQPENESDDVDLLPILTWDYGFLSDKCSVEVALDPDFEDVVYDLTNTSHNQKQVKLTSSLAPDKTYYWHVRNGFKDEWSEWSEIWSFTTTNATGLLEMIAPVNNATQIKLIPSFQWKMHTDLNDTTDTYHLKVSEYPDFDYCDIDIQKSYDEVYTPPAPLKGNMTYYWKVKVDFAGSTTGWSDIWKFQTEGEITFEADYVYQGGQNNPFYDLDFNADPFLSFVDIDNNGKYDCFVANKNGDIVFCQNAGTLNKPAFVPRTMYFDDLDYSGRAHIDFCDIDDDGDQDAFITGLGSSTYIDSLICLHKNIGNKEIAEFEFVDPENLNFDLPTGLTPNFIDIDNDKDYDLFLKKLTYSGKYSFTYIKFYENTGNKTNPIFELQSNINPIIPHDFDLVDIDGDDDQDLFCTYTSNEESLYLNRGSIENFQFEGLEKYHSPLSSINTKNSSIKFIDIDKDGDFDLFVGKPDGTINYYKNEYKSTDVNDNKNDYHNSSAFPNPFSSGININYDLQNADHVLVQIYDIQGNLIDTLLDEYQTDGSQSLQWQPEEIPSGRYVCTVKTGSTTSTIKIIRIK